MRWWNITTSLFSSFQASSIVITFYFDELSHLHLWNWKSERKSADRKIFRVEVGIVGEKFINKNTHMACFHHKWRKLEFHKSLFSSGKFSTWKKLSLNWNLLKRNSKWGNKYRFLFLKYAPSTLPTQLSRDCVCLNCWLLATMLNERYSIVVCYSSLYRQRLLVGCHENSLPSSQA